MVPYVNGDLYFVRAGKSARGKYPAQLVDQRLRGVKEFKRRTLGFRGSKSVKTLEEMSAILIDMGMAESEKEVGRVIQAIINRTLVYSGGYIQVEEVKSDVPNEKDQIRYRITKIPQFSP